MPMQNWFHKVRDIKMFDGKIINEIEIRKLKFLNICYIIYINRNVVTDN